MELKSGMPYFIYRERRLDSLADKEIGAKLFVGRYSGRDWKKEKIVITEYCMNCDKNKHLLMKKVRR